MRAVLRSLFDDVPRECAVDAIRSTQTFAALCEQLRSGSGGHAAIGGIPDGDYGDNLLMALLALRVKFPYEDAAAKLEVNIAMRSQRAGTTRA
jgi:hypothetical protein